MGIKVPRTFRAENDQQKTAILQRLHSEGFVVSSQTDSALFLSKRKQLGPAGVILLIISFLVFILPGIIFLAVWASRKPETAVVYFVQGASTGNRSSGGQTGELSDRLRRLEDLRDRGTISAAEFSTAKQNILSEQLEPPGA